MAVDLELVKVLCVSSYDTSSGQGQTSFGAKVQQDKHKAHSQICEQLANKTHYEVIVGSVIHIFVDKCTNMLKMFPNAPEFTAVRSEWKLVMVDIDRCRKCTI